LKGLHVVIVAHTSNTLQYKAKGVPAHQKEYHASDGQYTVHGISHTSYPDIT